MIKEIRQLPAPDLWAWAFRLFMAVLMILATIVGYLANLVLQDVRDTAKASLARMETVQERVVDNNSTLRLHEFRLDRLEARGPSITP